MHVSIANRRLLGLWLLGSAAIAFLSVAIMIVLLFTGFDVSRTFFELFVTPGMDAPDNWAVALTRIFTLLCAIAATGAVTATLGLWLLRQVATD